MNAKISSIGVHPTYIILIYSEEGTRKLHLRHHPRTNRLVSVVQKLIDANKPDVDFFDNSVMFMARLHTDHVRVTTHRPHGSHTINDLVEFHHTIVRPIL